MEKQICEWLLEDENPEVKLRTLKEYLKYDDGHPEVIRARENLLSSKIYAGIIEKLHSDKKWDKFDALMALSEWGLTRNDVAKIDEEVFCLIEETNSKMACAEPFLLRDLVKLGYYSEPVVKEEILSISAVSSGIKIAGNRNGFLWSDHRIFFKKKYILPHG